MTLCCSYIRACFHPGKALGLVDFYSLKEDSVNASVKLIEQVIPSTVTIRVTVPSQHRSAQLLGTERMGSGAVIDTDGYILTRQLYRYWRIECEGQYGRQHTTRR